MANMRSTAAGPDHSASRSFSDGELILDRFRIVRYVGGGGMGEVYEAIDLEMGRIALKTIRPEIANNPDMLARFKKEVALALKISGPHVCRIHAFFPHAFNSLTDSARGAKRAFLTMEFLEGITLADKISESGPLPWREAKAIALEICEGLQTIHDAGVIHRDLKPRNIMLASRNGSICAVVMDFGLAREVASSTSETATNFNSDSQGQIEGTLNSMAPEQFEGEEVRPATDIYALGVVLYELVTGQQPFGANTPIGAAIQRGKRPSPVSSLRHELPHLCDEIICKCLEFDLNLRYQSASELADDLRGGLFSPARFRKNWFRVLAGAACLILILAGLMLVPAIRERVQGILFSSREKHIAVLPFDIAGNDPQTQALGDGLMDSLAGKLSNLDAANQTLWVVPASEVRSRKVRDPSSALREFGATIVVQGSFERNGPAANLKLTLIDPKKMREIGFADVDNQAGDLAALEDEAVTRLGRLMNVSVRGELTQGTGQGVTRAAYEDYLTGLGYYQRFDKPGNLERAIQALQSAVKTDPHFALGFAQLAQVYVMRFRLESNPEWLKQAEYYSKRASELDDRVPSTYVALAKIHQLTGNHGLAVQEFQRAIDLDPKDADALVGMAHAYESAGRIPDAEATYTKAAQLRPDDWMGYNELGMFYDRVGRPLDAILQYRRALELAPDNAGLYSNIGSAYLNSGDPQMLTKSEETLKESVAISPTFEPYGNLGVLYLIQHRFRDSIAATHKAIQLNDREYDLWSNLADGHEWLGEEEQAGGARRQALVLLEQAIRRNPKDADAQATIAAIYAKDGLGEKAVEHLQISLALSPNSQYVLSEAADVYELLGNRPLARDYLVQAIAHGMKPEELNGDPEIRGVLTDPVFRRAIQSSSGQK